MALFKLTRYRICAFIACALLPIFFLLPGQISRFSFSSFIPFSNTVSNDTLLSPYPLPTPVTKPNPELTDDITNNNATYPRLYLTIPTPYMRRKLNSSSIGSSQGETCFLVAPSKISIMR